MAINIHPEIGHYSHLRPSRIYAPEMIKRRPAVVISPRLRTRNGLCTVVSTQHNTAKRYCTVPFQAARLHPRYQALMTRHFHWVKADMIYTVSFR